MTRGNYSLVDSYYMVQSRKKNTREKLLGYEYHIDSLCLLKAYNVLKQ